MSLLELLEFSYRNTDLKSYPVDVLKFFVDVKVNVENIKNQFSSEGLWVGYYGHKFFEVDLGRTRKYKFLHDKRLCSALEKSLGLSFHIDENYIFTLSINSWDCEIDYYYPDMSESDMLRINYDNMLHFCFDVPLMELESFIPKLQEWYIEQNKVLELQGHF
jgi:hypothetical protein